MSSAAVGALRRVTTISMNCVRVASLNSCIEMGMKRLGSPLEASTMRVTETFFLVFELEVVTFGREGVADCWIIGLFESFRVRDSCC